MGETNNYVSRKNYDKRKKDDSESQTRDSGKTEEKKMCAIKK